MKKKYKFLIVTGAVILTFIIHFSYKIEGDYDTTFIPAYDDLIRLADGKIYYQEATTEQFYIMGEYSQEGEFVKLIFDEDTNEESMGLVVKPSFFGLKYTTQPEFTNSKFALIRSIFYKD